MSMNAYWAPFVRLIAGGKSETFLRSTSVLVLTSWQIDVQWASSVSKWSFITKICSGFDIDVRTVEMGDIVGEDDC